MYIGRTRDGKKYLVQQTILSEHVKKMSMNYGGETGDIYVCLPFKGVNLWAVDARLHQIPADSVEDYHYLKINYCIDGRCEINLQNGRYLYVDKNVVSVDSNQAMGEFYYPTGVYCGVEMILDLDILSSDEENILAQFGIRDDFLKSVLLEKDGSLLLTISQELQTEFTELYDDLINGNGQIEDYRFACITILYSLRKSKMKPLDEKQYLTKGQRMIADEVERRMTEDLSKHITVTELSREYGIAASSIKKYFSHMFGMPVSEYIRRKRMELAAELLKDKKISVATAASKCGYTHQGKFSAAFKEYLGVTPMEYKRLSRTGKGETV